MFQQETQQAFVSSSPLTQLHPVEEVQKSCLLDLLILSALKEKLWLFGRSRLRNELEATNHKQAPSAIRQLTDVEPHFFVLLLGSTFKSTDELSKHLVYLLNCARNTNIDKCMK